MKKLSFLLLAIFVLGTMAMAAQPDTAQPKVMAKKHREYRTGKKMVKKGKWMEHKGKMLENKGKKLERGGEKKPEAK